MRHDIKENKLANISYLRNFVFGVEDSLVSTVGLLSGIAIAGVTRETLFVTAIVLISVEAISMSAGSFLSESSVEAYSTKSDSPTKNSYLSTFIMFVSYFISGFIPLIPYLIFPTTKAFFISIVASILALGVLGVISAKISKTNISKSVLRMVFVGGLATLTGVIIGKIDFSSLFYSFY